MTTNPDRFHLPTPNHPLDAPDHDRPVAVWHARFGLVRARCFRGAWISEIRTMADTLAGSLSRENVLGWWPDPEPPPPLDVVCPYCGARASVPRRPLPPGLFGGFTVPAFDRLPAGWERFDPPCSLERVVCAGCLPRHRETRT